MGSVRGLTCAGKVVKRTKGDVHQTLSIPLFAPTGPPLGCNVLYPTRLFQLRIRHDPYQGGTTKAHVSKENQVLGSAAMYILDLCYILYRFLYYYIDYVFKEVKVGKNIYIVIK
jgi:hypothetical protein